MGIVDISSIVILFFCAGYGLYNGFIKISFYLLSVVVGSFVAGKLYIYGGNFLPENDWTFLFSFAIIFFITSFLIIFIGKFLTTFLEKVLLKPIDRILGMILVLFLGILMIGIIYNGLANANPQIIKKFKIDNSKVIMNIYKFDTKFYEILPNFVKEKFASKNLIPKNIKENAKKENKNDLEKIEDNNELTDFKEDINY
jgi:uncharacterized membrane protein required for colicin V production